jgi:hypothetical protein
MKTSITTSLICYSLIGFASAQTQNYPDTTGEVAVGSFPHLDITSVDVTVNLPNITFQINLAGSPLDSPNGTNWGKYLIGIHSSPGGAATGNGWGRPINFSPGMTHWIGNWADAGGDTAGGGAFSYTSNSWNGSSTPTVTKTASSIIVTDTVTNLGLDPGETFSFDVYTSGGGGGDSAVDALSAAAASIPAWSGPYTTNIVGSPTNAARQFTMPGTLTFATWIGGFGLDLADQDEGDDPDLDGLTNLNEFNRSLNPNSSDTDGDELNDGAEITAGTNPLNRDSDSDGLTDGAEVNTHMTNPLLADTDKDGESDATEIFQGTNPVLATSSSAALGIPLVDGVRDTSLYASPLALQTVETGFGDNASEWNAAYSVISGDKLYLLLTGNLEATFNKLSIFIDSKVNANGNNVFDSAGNDNSPNMNGMTFDAGFEPDYHLIARRGSGKFDLDIANLDSKVFSSFQNVFGGTVEGRGITTAGNGNTMPIRVAYNGSNTAGIGGSSEGNAADQAAAAAVTTGLEICIDLADLGGVPTGPIKVAIVQTNPDHTFLSNQNLGGLPAPSPNLGTSNVVNFSTIAGNQFFTIGGASNLNVLSSRLASSSQFEFIAQGLELGATYVVQESTTLAGFSNVGASFVAGATVQVFPVPVTPGSVPKKFFRIRRP